MKSVLERDKANFIIWMNKNKKLEKKVSKDYYYRILRVENNICTGIEDLLSTLEGFIELVEMIEKYSISIYKNKKKSDVLSGTLRSSVKKYGEYKYPLMADFYKKPFVYNLQNNNLGP